MTDWAERAEAIKVKRHFNGGDVECFEFDQFPLVTAIADEVWEWCEPWFTPEALGYELVGDDPWREVTYWARPTPRLVPFWVRIDRDTLTGVRT